MSIKDIATATPAQIDAQIAELQDDYETLLRWERRAFENLHIIDGQTKVRVGRRRVWPISDEDTWTKVEGKLSELAQYDREVAKKALFTLDEALQGQESNRAKQAELDAEYVRRGRWTRYFLVDNDNGHVHSSQACSTCRATTHFFWLTDQSGKSADELVALAGEKACTVCFPWAPVSVLASTSHLEGPNQKAAREAREQRETERAEKAREAAEKAVTNPDGTPLFQVTDARDGGWRETGSLIKTEIAAQRQAAEAAYSMFFYGETHPQRPAWEETVRRCTEALAHKRGTTAGAERKAIVDKAEKKVRRDLKN